MLAGFLACLMGFSLSASVVAVLFRVWKGVPYDGSDRVWFVLLPVSWIWYWASFFSPQSVVSTKLLEVQTVPETAGVVRQVIEYEDQKIDLNTRLHGVVESGKAIKYTRYSNWQLGVYWVGTYDKLEVVDPPVSQAKVQ